MRNFVSSYELRVASKDNSNKKRAVTTSWVLILCFGARDTMQYYK